MYVDTTTIELLITAIDKDGVKELLDAYVFSTQDVIENLKKAQNDNDLENLMFYGHRLKGSSATLGLQCMRDVGKDIETFAKVKDLTNAKSAVNKLDGEFSRTIEELKAGYPSLF